MAVYTKLTKSEIEKHLINYQIGELIDFKEIVAGVDNSNFIIETSQAKFVLTIFEKRINSKDLPFYINLKLHLARKGIHCPKPIANKNGEIIVDLKEKKSAIATFLQGYNLMPQEDGYYASIKIEHCFELGKELAKMHLAAADFNMVLENNLGVFEFQNFFKKFSDSLDESLSDEIIKDLEFLNKSWQTKLPKFAIHADLFPDNVFFDDNSKLSGVIDFYFAANDLLILDFAIIVNAWCFDEKNNFIKEKYEAILKGYEEVRKFSSEEKSFLRLALIAAAMRFLLTRLHDKIFTPKDSLVKIKDPQEYLEKLRYFKSAC